MTLVTHADLGSGVWNDIVIDGRGNVYVNGAAFNPMAGEAPKPGAVWLVTPDRQVREVAGDFGFPNGMAVTADNATLIVADSYRHCLVAFDIAADGGLSGRRVWADLGEGTPLLASPRPAVTPTGRPRRRSWRRTSPCSSGSSARLPRSAEHR